MIPQNVMAFLQIHCSDECIIQAILWAITEAGKGVALCVREKYARDQEDN